MRILIVDNHLLFRENLVSLLQSEPEIEIAGEAGSCAEAIQQVQESNPDLILVDPSLPDGSWLDLMGQVSDHQPSIRFVLLAVSASEDSLLEAAQCGASGYLLKGEDLARALSMLGAVDQDEFVLSPRMAPSVLSGYNDFKMAKKNGAELQNLTAREREVLEMICQGATNREIAERFVISENTVRIHVQNILRKLDLKNRREAREKYGAALSLERT